jgi:hypothetical protein
MFEFDAIDRWGPSLARYLGEVVPTKVRISSRSQAEIFRGISGCPVQGAGHKAKQGYFGDWRLATGYRYNR